MDITISSINFKSNIKLITIENFKDKTKNLAKELHEVDYPWNPNVIQTGRNIFTQGINDCIAGGIIFGDKVRIFHQANWTEKVAKKFSQPVFNPKDMEEKLLEGINTAKDNIHGLLLGGIEGRDCKEDSFLNKVLAIFDKNNIPCSMFLKHKKRPFLGHYSLLYENETDTWNITNTRINNNTVILKDSNVQFDTYLMCDEDYIRIPTTANTEGYLRDEFLDVKLSKYDKFI